MSIQKLVEWSPRVLSMIFIVFIMLFSLDIFEPGVPWYDIIVGLFIHNIPAFILIIILWLSLNKPLIGAITYFLLGVLYIIWVIVVTDLEMFGAILAICLPSMIIGILYFIDYKYA